MFASLAGPAFGQNLRPGQNVRAIVGARIQVNPTTVIENGTVLIANGVISQVGASVTIPPGAERIDGKGLVVYAGFVDGYTNLGTKTWSDAPRQDTQPDITADVVTQMRSGAFTNFADILGADVYNPDDDVWKGYRSSGFTTALVSPSGGVIQGTGSLINLDGQPRRFSVVQPASGISVRLEGQGSVYPGTRLGAYATLRQSFLDSERWEASHNAFRAGSAYRALNDPNLAALISKIPLLIQASSIAEIDRTLDLAAELKRRPILIGAAQGWKGIERIKSEKCGLLLSLAFGQEPFPATKTPAKPPTPDSDEPEESPGKKQEDQRIWLEKVQNPILLSKAGVPFGFTTLGSKNPGEFFANLRRCLKEGLPKEAAIAALTVTPSALCGLDKVLGTIEPGKIADLTILTGDLADENSKVKWLIIDGAKIDPDPSTPKPVIVPRVTVEGSK